jgi:hypothetical protein
MHDASEQPEAKRQAEQVLELCAGHRTTKRCSAAFEAMSRT